MANTYTQLDTHFIFAPRYRAALIYSDWEEHLYRYITGIVQAHGHKMLAVGGMPDHLHALVGRRPTQGESDLMEDVKAGSSGWINDSGLCRSRFEWQRGYGAFVVELKNVPGKMAYVRGQKEHHKKVTFLQEYRALLEEHGVEYDEQYIFHEPE